MQQVLSKIHFGFSALAAWGSAAEEFAEESYPGLLGRIETNGSCEDLGVYPTPVLFHSLG